MKAILFILILACVILNGLDYLSTSLVLSEGRGTEGNPIVKLLIKLLGKYWWASKLPILGLCIFAWFSVIPSHGVIAFLALDALFGWVVYHNYKILWRQA